MKVILDTNFLMIPIQFKIDIFDEIERIVDGEYGLFIFEGTKRELRNLAKGDSKKSTSAKMALDIVKDKEINTLKSKKIHVDDAILEIADENTIVATNDKKLRRELKNKNVKVIYLRNKKYLEMM